jgi:hypothetical protein
MNMRTLRIVAAALPMALAACASQDAAPFQDAAPSYSALAMDMTGAATAGGMAAGPAALVADPMPLDAVAATPADTCHPHLFLRTADLAMRVNRHLWKYLRHIEVLSVLHPDHITSGEARWQRTHGRVEVRWTVTKVSDEVYQWLLEARSAVHPDWLAIFSGQIDRTGAGGPHQGKGNATLDLSALQAVEPLEKASGVVDASFESFPGYRKLVVDAKAVVWDGDGLTFFVGTPADAHYVYYRAPGKGGSFKAHDQMVFVCPVVNYAPPALPPPGDVRVLTRWYVAAAGSPAYYGRSDAAMTGGQLPAAGRVVGLTCQTAAFDATPTAEAYWLMKQEDTTAGDATVASWGPLGDPGACDAAFGAVPTIADAAKDFDFGSVDFDSAAPGPFPGGP